VAEFILERLHFVKPPKMSIFRPAWLLNLRNSGNNDLHGLGSWEDLRVADAEGGPEGVRLLAQWSGGNRPREHDILEVWLSTTYRKFNITK
jgi:hypothetical protein